MDTKPNYKKTLFACYRGYITQAVVVNLMPLFFVIFQDHYNISFVMLGNLILLNFVTQLLTDAASIKFVGKLGYRKTALAAHALAAIGFLLLGTLHFLIPLLPALFISTVVFAIGGGLLEVVVSPVVESIPGEAKEQAMSILHSFYCWGVILVVLVTTVFLRFFGNESWMIVSVLWAILPIYNFIAFLKVPILPPLEEEKSLPLKTLFKSRIFVVILLMMTCGGAAELGMAQWASLFTEKALGIPKTIGDVLGPCFFAAMMGIGRMIYGIFGHKIRLLRVIVLSSVLCIASYFIAALSDSPIISLIGCAFCGFSVSLMWPGMLSCAAAIFKSGGAAMFCTMALFGDIGCSVGPWLVGLVSEINASLGEIQALRTGMASGAIFPFILLLGSIYLIKKTK